MHLSVRSKLCNFGGWVVVILQPQALSLSTGCRAALYRAAAFFERSREIRAENSTFESEYPKNVQREEAEENDQLQYCELIPAAQQREYPPYKKHFKNQDLSTS